jgi:hypothetical protein
LAEALALAELFPEADEEEELLQPAATSPKHTIPASAATRAPRFD